MGSEYPGAIYECMACRKDIEVTSAWRVKRYYSGGRVAMILICMDCYSSSQAPRAPEEETHANANNTATRPELAY